MTQYEIDRIVGRILTWLIVILIIGAALFDIARTAFYFMGLVFFADQIG